MIEYKMGDIFSEDVEAIVNTVNCVGVMGKGLALQFKKKYPQNYKEYQLACQKKEVRTGKMFVHQTGQLTNPKYIINFPTKNHWKEKSKLEYIESGLDDLIRVINEMQIQSIAIPALGSTNGGLDWREVKKMIEMKLSNVGTPVLVFEPLEQKIEIAVSKKRPKMTPGRAALIGLIDQYLKGLLDPYVTLLEVHKLMYFMQEAGEPLQLKYQKALYGPYADNLRHVMNLIEGHFISGYEDGGDAPGKQIQLINGAVEEAKKFLSDALTTQQNLKRVAELVDGFETPFGLELLSTVHWVVKYEKASTIDEVIKKVYDWNARKKQFSAKQIQIALNTLIKYKWVSL